jgi:hypothetical protein
MIKVKEFEKFIKDFNIFMRHVVYKMDFKKYLELKNSFDNYLI